MITFDGRPCRKHARISPCCALFETARLQELLAEESFTVCIDESNHWDVGSRIYEAACRKGWITINPRDLFARIRHYGHVSFRHAEWADTEMRKSAEDNYSQIQRRLAEMENPL